MFNEVKTILNNDGKFFWNITDYFKDTFLLSNEHLPLSTTNQPWNYERFVEYLSSNLNFFPQIAGFKFD